MGLTRLLDILTIHFKFGRLDSRLVKNTSLQIAWGKGVHKDAFVFPCSHLISDPCWMDEEKETPSSVAVIGLKITSYSLMLACNVTMLKWFNRTLKLCNTTVEASLSVTASNIFFSVRTIQDYFYCPPQGKAVNKRPLLYQLKLTYVGFTVLVKSY